jgi:hypothetical protein
MFISCILRDTDIHCWLAFCVVIQWKDTPLWWLDVLFTAAKVHARHGVIMGTCVCRFLIGYGAVAGLTCVGDENNRHIRYVHIYG